MADLKEVPANDILLGLSKLAGYGKSALNYPGKLPIVGGAGDLVFGEAPEALEDWAYGFKPPLRGKGMTTSVDPRVMDIAGLPVVGGILSKVGKKAARAVLPEQQQLGQIVRKGSDDAMPVVPEAPTPTGPESPTRRKLMKGAVGAAVTAPLAGPLLTSKLIRGGAKGVVPELAPAAVRAGAALGASGLESLRHAAGWMKGLDELPLNEAAMEMGSGIPYHQLDTPGIVAKDLEELTTDPQFAKLLAEAEEVSGVPLSQDYVKSILQQVEPTMGPDQDTINKFVDSMVNEAGDAIKPRIKPEFQPIIDRILATGEYPPGELGEKLRAVGRQELFWFSEKHNAIAKHISDKLYRGIPEDAEFPDLPQ